MDEVMIRAAIKSLLNDSTVPVNLRNHKSFHRVGLGLISSVVAEMFAETNNADWSAESCK